MDESSVKLQIQKQKLKKSKLKRSKSLNSMSNLRRGSLKGSVQSSFSFDMNDRGDMDSDFDSEPDRSHPLWKTESVHENEVEEKEEVNREEEKIKPTIWEEIMFEYEEKRQEFFTGLELIKPYEPELPICGKISASQYVEKYIFPTLCPALEETICKAKQLNFLRIQKGRFNGLDFLSELLWNRNPSHPERHKNYVEIFNIPFAVLWLSQHPRPIYPLSWLWTEEEAITVIQTYIRRYFVCKESECSEMRQFWRILKQEENDAKTARREKSIQQIELLFNQIFEKLIADAVFEKEYKSHGSRCVHKPCHCMCKCKKWCKCCKCYKVPENQGKVKMSVK